MKRLLALLCLCAALCAPIAVQTGCKSPPTASQAAYSTLDGVGAAVDAAMKTAAQLRVAGKISSADWQRIADAHAKFRVGFNSAVDAAAVALDRASVPADLAALAGDVLSLISTFQGK